MDRIDPPRFGVFAVLGILAAATLLGPSSKITRVAVRIDCTNAAACALAESLAEDVWSEDRGADLPLDVVIASDKLDQLDQFGNYQILVPDIDAVAQAEHDRLALGIQSADWFAEYHDYNGITQHIQQLAEIAPDRATMHGIGSSIDGRTIWALRIGHGPTKMLVNGTQHAREWIAAMTTTCVADRLVREYDTDPAIKKFVDSTDLWVVPVVNPDGYQYSWSTSRYWRKNRREKHGVDLNRNWSVAWGGSGSSGSKGSDIYRGAYAFSEPETAAMRDLSKREGFALAVDFHTYGQLVLYPWNYTAAPSKDRDRFAGVGDRLASAIFSQHKKQYRLMSGVELYPSAGTASDWYYGELGALAYTIELRPKGGSGFVLPPEEIKPTCDEGLAAVLALRSSRE